LKRGSVTYLANVKGQGDFCWFQRCILDGGSGESATGGKKKEEAPLRTAEKKEIEGPITSNATTKNNFELFDTGCEANGARIYPQHSKIRGGRGGGIGKRKVYC